MLRNVSFAVALLGTAVVFGGCQGAQYDDRYVYHPRPMTVETPEADQAEAGTVRTLVSVVGVRRADDEAELPASVHVRLRLDNTTDGEARFDPRSLELFAADVSAFAPPILRPDEVLTLQPGDSATVDAYFPLPGDRYPGNADLSGLSARWTVQVDERELRGSATFARREQDYYRRYREPRFNVGFGYGYHRWY